MSIAYATCAKVGCNNRIEYLTTGSSRPFYCGIHEPGIRERLEHNISEDESFWATHTKTQHKLPSQQTRLKL